MPEHSEKRDVINLCNETGFLFCFFLLLSMVGSKPITLKQSVSKYRVNKQYFLKGPLVLLIPVDALLSFWTGKCGS